MAGVLQHLRSSTLNKRPNPASMVDGQIAINYASGSPGAFFKDTNGNLVKVGPVHVGATAPNVSPASGGTAGNSLGEQWLDTSGGTYVFKIWDGAAWRSEAGEFVNSTGDTMTGSLTMGPSANLIFEGSTDDGFETTLTVVDPTADRTITLPNVSGTVVTTGDSGTVTSTMIADGTIVNADVNASAAIAGTKISPDFGSQTIQTTGVFSHAVGSAGAPTITFTGDTNTGIYSPGADQVAISTGGSGRLFVDASGNIGVGTTPDARFTVQDGTSNILRAKQVAFNNYINEGVGLTFGRTSDGAETMAIGVVDVDKLTIASREGILFGVGGGGLYSAVSEAARIDSSGRFLVGTSSGKTVGTGQYSLLNVQGYVGASNGGGDVTLSRGETAANIATGEVLGLISFTDSAGYAFGQFYCEADGNAGTNDYPGRLVFATTADGASSPTERLRITSAGFVGVGTSSPGFPIESKLTGVDSTIWGYNVAQFADATANNTGLRIGTNTFTSGLTQLIAATNSAASQFGFWTYNGSAWGERMRLDSSGRLGIGTASPGYALDTRGAIASTSASGIQTVLSFASDGIVGTVSNHSLTFFANNGERARIDTSGRLLVGTSSASVFTFGGVTPRFQVEGTDASTGTVSIARNSNDANGAGLIISKSRGTTAGSNTIVSNNDTIADVRFEAGDGTQKAIAGAISCQVDGTPGANDMPGRIVLSTTADGASSPTERMRISQDGTVGIYNSSYLQPAVDNAVYLGAGTNLRWVAVYAANGTIQTSDLRQKTDIANSSLGAEFIKSLRPVSYKFTVGGNKPTGETDEDGNWLYAPTPGKRTHWGFVAQEVKQAIDDAGVDFGGWILDDPNDPDSDQGLRYDQFIAPLTKALQEALAEIDVLKAKVAALESA